MRAAAALAALGHEVVAAEPTAELRARGEALHAGQDLGWVDDALPDLTELRGTHGLELIHLAERVDPHDRQDVSWTWLAFQTAAHSGATA
ncbi:hypothetical protein [Nonomuraea sp. NPDC049607]|uniref:hypothetical protein n=1 Tax=Nonomuraea sp. NPDC049607 TaxID=3154732 RepID=UPI0034355AAA